MNALQKSRDPLLQSLAEEAADLPVLAANEARRRKFQSQRHQQRFAVAATVSLLGVFIWFVIPSREVQPTTADAHHGSSENSVTHTPPKPDGLGFVKQEDATSAHPPLPTSLDEEQLAIVRAAGDLPLLLVRDDSGKVTRIHVVER